jgi:hypothetical protein
VHCATNIRVRVNSTVKLQPEIAPAMLLHADKWMFSHNGIAHWQCTAVPVGAVGSANAECHVHAQCARRSCVYMDSTASTMHKSHANASTPVDVSSLDAALQLQCLHRNHTVCLLIAPEQLCKRHQHSLANQHSFLARCRILPFRDTPKVCAMGSGCASAAGSPAATASKGAPEGPASSLSCADLSSPELPPDSSSTCSAARPRSARA